MPEVSFVLSAAQSYALRELAETLADELALQGVPSSISLDAFPMRIPAPVYVLLNPWEFANLPSAPALPGDDVLRRTIFVCAEPPPAITDTEHRQLLGRAGSVFGLDQRAIVDMHRLRIAARLLRPGYARSLDHFDASVPRPIDVLFLGTASERRSRHLHRIAEILGAYDCRFEVSETSPRATNLDHPLARGRWSLLAQAKVLIDLHHGEQSRFAWRKALDAIQAGAVVVSEHASGIAPLVPGEHLFVAGAESLADVVGAVLRDEQRLRHVRGAAYDRLSSWIPYALWVSVLRAAVVELVGEPVSAEMVRRTGP